ncbi:MULTISPECIES: bifunctional (p)ppGpp synthetase/guanosine-3',5'-bis(diphosphate) 3'-pyrophosphohydrolase [unclassified Granulicatella]|uniref:RelA/SpoT family protein n=1 Tax=unclassified Granulicatella TaxID=2630493 RepID=UPI0010744AEC|nr:MULTISPECIES: bifunctional (p)ppGpp synthetase/guanosine-3',5'-bis(diphosphate) 3'-pyrophosphohydrolase [unclassified Granulicatella]MBF0780385.1 bifunctional (p)ppGpp synthetase/guanosine-3',5'-bis(diphosphate) 3'-pyrophosphohydrolase [Granulicatella sp. 19428wC4_WM01]TFU95473.1 bifunctional (p)ppGpp synthetase/guanosine-3',5'-bis(diphosphate) 3'-pyrophosphohydrolase [Granulicatella sp. WM01]
MAKQGDYSVQDVFDMCRAYMNDEHVSFIQKAYAFAKKAHEGIVRKSGEPYIIHPVQVAGMLAKLYMDPFTVATGFLHDVVEDTEYTYEDMVKEFSQTVADLIEGVTKIGQVEYQSKVENKAENHRKMLLAMSNDLRVIIIKLADRLHNMRTMEYQTPEKQKQKSEETLEIYAPLAHRLGMSKIKWELEDLSLRYLETEQYYNIVKLMKDRREERERMVQETIDTLKKVVTDMSITAEINGRPKHIYSIYKKMVNKKKEFDEIYDLLAVRVLVSDIKDCYAVLGAVHTKWTPLPGRFKDYIAMPKPNMYQSLHTTVIGPGGTPVEIQIRTFEMHRIAENGVAAHWAYKEGVTRQVEETPLQNHMNWFRNLLDLQQDSQNASDFIESVKTDIFKDRVYVFTPKGDVTELPKGSGPLDFAYSVHTELGNKTIGASVNGRQVGLDTRLKTGDIIEIRTSHNAKPSPDWLKFVVTSRARNKIKRYFKLQERDISIQRGKEMLEKAIHDLDFDPKEFMTKEKMMDIIERFNTTNEQDIYASIGFGELSALSVCNRLTEDERRLRESELEKQKLFSEPEKPKQAMKIRDENGIIVSGGDNLLIRLSRCCRPVPGDLVVGYITKGHGISVHRQDCPNVHVSGQEKNRLIDVEWDAVAAKKTLNYDTELIITGYDRHGIFTDIVNTVNSIVKRLNSIHAKVDDNTQTVTVTLRVGIQDIGELDRLVEKLKMITDVYRVHRVIS